ncbi:hypothetical protein ACHAWF_002621 [Thalassiosira exigua]
MRQAKRSTEQGKESVHPASGKRAMGHLRNGPSPTTTHHSLDGFPSVCLTLHNWLLIDGDQREDLARLLGGGTGDRDDGNLQEPSEESKKGHSSTNDDTNNNNNVEVVDKSEAASRSTRRQSKPNTILQDMLNRDNEELCLQKADLPFFGNALDWNPLTSFTSAEVELAGELGRGEFCRIDLTSRSFCALSARSGRLTSGTSAIFATSIEASAAPYAAKRIQCETIRRDEITLAAIDLAREVEFLAALIHPSIVRIWGKIDVPGHPKHGLVLDRLYDTLKVRMKQWKVEHKRCKGKVHGLIGKGKLSLEHLWSQRLFSLSDLASAMTFVHSKG